MDHFDEIRICHECIGEGYLAAEMRRIGSRAHCHYCGKSRRAVALSTLADEIESAFTRHFIRTADQPSTWEEAMMRDRESNYSWTREGYEVVDAIEDAAGISREAASDVQELLDHRHGNPDPSDPGDETEFAPDSYYEEKVPSDAAWAAEWNRFEDSLKKEARFFNQQAAEHLRSIFVGLSAMKTWEGVPIVVDAGPGRTVEALFRARVFQSDASLVEALQSPEKNLGPPPPRRASAGRMNASGVAVFYSATDSHTAITEVRPPVGSQVVVAKFSITRNLRLLDLRATERLASVEGSIFDPAYAVQLERIAFLRTLCNRLASPVMPEDEVLDYLPTQAVADFLATSADEEIDGIIFPSVQAGNAGSNVVLFNKACRIEERGLPKGTEIIAETFRDTEDGPEREYTVYERVPRQSSNPPSAPDGDFALLDELFEPGHLNERFDPRVVTLRLNVDSISIHIVKRVVFETEDHDVHMHRLDEREHDDF